MGLQLGVFMFFFSTIKINLICKVHIIMYSVCSVVWVKINMYEMLHSARELLKHFACVVSRVSAKSQIPPIGAPWMMTPLWSKNSMDDDAFILSGLGV